eukprot:1159993-Pelagomonas_calceolata.AAC.5
MQLCPITLHARTLLSPAHMALQSLLSTALQAAIAAALQPPAFWRAVSPPCPAQQHSTHSVQRMEQRLHRRHYRLHQPRQQLPTTLLQAFVVN